MPEGEMTTNGGEKSVPNATSSPSCRILVVSKSVALAMQFAHRVLALNDKSFQPPLAESTPSGETSTSPPPSSSTTATSPPTVLPWTITNRYYSAAVHFHVQSSTHEMTYDEVRGLRAAIFVWGQDEDYRRGVGMLARDLAKFDVEPEVCLAVRMNGEAIVDVNKEKEEDEEEEEEEDADIDEFLSGHGFEFIDEETEGSEGRSFSEGIPGLRRVLDALGTIMWPSMQAKQERKADKQSLNWAQSTMDSTWEDEDTHDVDDEIKNLARWLDKETVAIDEEEVWSRGAVVSSPVVAVSSPPAIQSGFDDDFTVFVSAPSESGASTAGGLFPPHSGTYRSLGSVSDLGEEQEDENDGLPSREEIRNASARIFGSGFDLSEVVETLREIKSEIGGIENEEERRKAAARIALGLVYGLEEESV